MKTGLSNIFQKLAEKVYLDPVRAKLKQAQYPGREHCSDPTDFQPASRGATRMEEDRLTCVLQERTERMSRIFGNKPL